MRLGNIEVTGGFLLLLAWLNYLDQNFFIPMALLSCAAHELGHIAVLHMLGREIKVIRLTAIGAELVVSQSTGYWQEGISALAGPGINLFLALLCCSFTKGLTFAGLNLALALFNLLPIGRLDGGRALHCTLALLAGPRLADWVRDWLDCLCTAGMLAMGFLLALFGGNITLLLVAFWFLAVFLRQNIYTFHRNKACQRSRKKVQ